MQNIKQTSVLLIDDDKEFCQLIAEYLGINAFHTDYVNTGGEGIDKCADNYDIILLDMMLPDTTGTETLKAIRRKTSVPVIILSAHNDETDRILSLELGADDYIAKTLSSRELIARMRAVLRRFEKPSVTKENSLICWGFELFPDKIKATFFGKPIPLTYVEFQILYTLLYKPGSIVSREKLLSLFAEKEWNKFDRSVDVHVSDLRKKLTEITGVNGLSLIQTLRGMGYMFVLPDNL